MVATTLNGITFINFNEIDINKGDEAICCVDEKFKDTEVALKVSIGCNSIIGYIPKLSTIQKWGEEAKAQGDVNKYQYCRDRYRSTKFIRDNVITDLYRNKINNIPCKVGNISRDEDDNVISVSVIFDYM
jgi:hypothetical protein|tara:strand:+ start:497 stop:886 length:390 start_codon:yes stop_codon:yes gene_type:complete